MIDATDFIFAPEPGESTVAWPCKVPAFLDVEVIWSGFGEV